MSNATGLANLKQTKHLNNILYVFLILNYIFIMILIAIVNLYKMTSVPLFFLEFQRVAFTDLMISLLIIMLLILSVLFSHKGFTTASILYIVYLLHTGVIALMAAESSALTGILIITIGYISCVIIHHNNTNLPNRNRVLSEMNSLIMHANQNTDKFFVIHLDIDNYRVFRDYLGHIKGEQELQLFTNHLKSSIHPLDMTARMGDEEFIILVQRPLIHEELLDYVNHLQQELSYKITCNQNSFYLTCNYGICSYPQHGTNTEQLLKYADIACYEAKKNPRHPICFFDQNLYQKLVYNTTLENALKDVINNKELYLVYQPQYSCNSKELRGFEVLLRWNHPTFGLIPPSSFIPIAEKTGSIIPIGKWVLENACEAFHKILDKYNTNLILSVNISTVQLLENSFLDTVTTVLEKTGFPPSLLEFEITETVLITSKETVIRILQELKKMGIHIALDDFGTEYASLSYLQLLPLDILKIDRSFINNIDEGDKCNLVESIITIAKKQSLVTIAEGIETENQLHYLKDQGCQFIQGFLWGRPISCDALDILLSDLKKQDALPQAR